jgi:hypothetical protein
MACPLLGVKPMMTENPRYQTARDIADEAIDALLTMYWVDSFDADLLHGRLADLILFSTRNARSLTEPHPNPESLEENNVAIAPPVSSDLGLSASLNPSIA